MKEAKQQCVLVTGATGAVGPRVVQALHDAGYWVRTLSINPPPPGIWPDGVDARLGDVTDREAVLAAMQGVDAVVHLAAVLHVLEPGPEMRERYERINLGGTETVVTAAVEAGVSRLVFFSTIAVYGPSNGSMLDERSPARPETFYARTKHDAEQVVLNARRKDGQPLGTVLRLGAVYGSRVKGNYERLTRALAGHRFVPVGNGLNRRTLVYDRDVGQAAVLAVSHPAAAGRVFNVTDGEFHTMTEIIDSICDALGRRPPVVSLPPGPVIGLIDFVVRACRVMKFGWSRSSITEGPGIGSGVLSAMRGAIEKYTEDVAVDGSLFQREIGFVPGYDLETGWREAVRDMRKEDGPPLSSQAVKRAFDLTLCLLLGPVLLLPMLVIGAAVRLTSGAPALYWSERMGRGNTVFRMPKFRTMRRDTPLVATHLLPNPGEHLTPIGAFLRKTSLDELPQFWCVLKGDMSFVGPRPALPSQDDLIALRTQKGIHRLIPGITGWAQINGRDGIPIPVKVDLEHYYLSRRSILFDLKILLATLLKVIHAENVSH